MQLHYSIFCLFLLLTVGFVRGQVSVDTLRVAHDPGVERLARGSSGSSRKVIGPPLAQATKDSLIKNIRVIFQRINRDTPYRVESLEPEEVEDIIGGSPDNGAEVNGYFKGDTLYKFTLSGGPSFGLKDYEYYFDKGQIVFIYEKDQHYPQKKDGELDHERLVVGFEGRFYFNKGKLIAKVVKRYDDFMAEEIDEAYIKELLDVSAYVEQLRKHVKPKK